MNIDDQFNLRRRHPLTKHYLLINAYQSVLARFVLENELDVSYGETPGQSVDIFPAAKKSGARRIPGFLGFEGV